MLLEDHVLLLFALFDVIYQVYDKQILVFDRSHNLVHLAFGHFIHDLFYAVSYIHYPVIFGRWHLVILLWTPRLFDGILLLTIFDFNHKFLVFNFFAQQIFNLVTLAVVIKNFVPECIYLSVQLILLLHSFFGFLVQFLSLLGTLSQSSIKKFVISICFLSCFVEFICFNV